jgi:hypothetical protein
MTQWRYRITIHTVPDILTHLPEPAEDVPPMIFCDDRGACYFDSGLNPLTEAIELVLNEVGEEHWELTQIAFRPDQMICFWKQPS